MKVFVLGFLALTLANPCEVFAVRIETASRSETDRHIPFKSRWKIETNPQTPCKPRKNKSKAIGIAGMMTASPQIEIPEEIRNIIREKIIRGQIIESRKAEIAKQEEEKEKEK